MKRSRCLLLFSLTLTACGPSDQTGSPANAIAQENRQNVALSPAAQTLLDGGGKLEEIIAARRLYERHGWPTIDVTRRSVEETAAAVLNLLHGGHGQVEVLG